MTCTHHDILEPPGADHMQRGRCKFCNRPIAIPWVHLPSLLAGGVGGGYDLWHQEELIDLMKGAYDADQGDS